MGEQQRPQGLLINLSANLFLLFLIQSIAAGIITWQTGLALNSILPFLALLFGHHLLLMLILSLMLNLFVYTRDNSVLKKINLPIFITLFRISSLPVIVYLLILINEYRVFTALAVYTLLVFLSDFLDGNLSRRYRLTTKVGAYLDSMSDYAVLIVISVIYMIYNLLPAWFFVLVAARLFFQWAAAGFMVILKGNIGIHRSSFLAKLSIFMVMSSYALTLTQFIPFFQEWYPGVSRTVQIVVTPVIVASLVEKAIQFIQDIRSRNSGESISSASPRRSEK